MERKRFSDSTRTPAPDGIKFKLLVYRHGRKEEPVVKTYTNLDEALAASSKIVSYEYILKAWCKERAKYVTIRERRS